MWLKFTILGNKSLQRRIHYPVKWQYLEDERTPSETNTRYFRRGTPPKIVGCIDMATSRERRDQNRTNLDKH